MNGSTQHHRPAGSEAQSTSPPVLHWAVHDIKPVLPGMLPFGILLV